MSYSFAIHNTSTSDVTLSSLAVSWGPTGTTLQQIMMGGNAILTPSGGALSPVITSSFDGSPADLVIPAGGTVTVTITFSSETFSLQFIRLTFTPDGCQVP